MTKETMRHIFDPFFTTKETGRGLGLSSVLGIMRGHKGGISVNSVINEGTTLALLFPIGDQIPIPFPDVVSEISTTRVNRGVLVIDDEAPIREAIADILEWEELPVFLVSNGKDGIEIYRIHLDDIDLILLDLSMPGMGGEETFKALRAINNEVRIILCSGYSKQEVDHLFNDYDITGFLSKPFSLDTLVDTLKKYMAHH